MYSHPILSTNTSSFSYNDLQTSTSLTISRSPNFDFLTNKEEQHIGIFCNFAPFLETDLAISLVISNLQIFKAIR